MACEKIASDRWTDTEVTPSVPCCDSRMRILHPSQVGYIQQANSTSSAATTTATKCAASAKCNATIEQLSSTTADYSTDLSNLNGNTTGRRCSYGLIDADDNVNLTISSSHNLSARYSRNQNHNTTSGKTESDSEILCNNLNQLNNLKSNNKEEKLNGNDNDIRQIFEGNLNVLEIEEKTSPKRLPQSSNPKTLQTRQDKTEEGTESSSKSTSNASDEEDGPDEPEEEEDEEGDLGNSGGRNLICNENHLNGAGRNSGGRSSPTLSQDSVELNNSGHINLSAAKLRQNLAKLDLDTNLQHCFQSHHHQQQFDSRLNQSRHTYKRVGAATPLDRHSRAGRVSGYSATYSCETSPDDSLMEDEDAYSPSPSSSNSLTSPEPSNFPRGIINPNYPGFQHLAHTLSEHFVNHSDADDSDLSEFEVELSVESLDDSFEHFHSNNCNNNNSLNNNNNDTITSISGLSGEESMPSNDELNYNLQITPPKENRDQKAICLPEIRVSSSLSNPEDGGDKNLDERSLDTDSDVSSKHLESDDEAKTNEDGAQCDDRIGTFYSAEDISCDLDTYLKKFETSTDVKTQEKENQENDTQQEEARNCPTPDILIKNEKSTCSRKSSANRPDLLKNVGGRLETAGCEHHHENHPIEPEKPSSRVLVPDNIAIETKRPEKDDGSYGVTPVDIIGDFGQEIEREFGLIVSGYNTRILCRDYSPSPCSDKKFSSKTADAVLSDGKEQLLVDSAAGAVVAEIAQIETLQPECITCDLLQSATAGNFHRPGDKPTAPPPPPPLEREKSKDEDASSTKVILTKNSGTGANNISSIGGCGEKLIPTAIVKPKYQKPSYDDRQLPPIGLGYSEKNRAWYETSKCPANAMIQPTAGAAGADQRSRKIIQQQFATQLDRNVKFSKKILNRSSGGNPALSGKLPNSRRYDKDSDGSSSVVAVVTPRKKEKFETSLSEKKCKSFAEKNNNNNNNSRSFSNNNFGCMETKRREVPKGPKDQPISASFDVYNIETALPVIDLEAIENHLKKAKEEERKRRNDREEIRRRLAMGAEDDYFSKIVSADRPGRKPSLQSRLQSGMNLQICFMNEASSDTESPSSDSETCPKLSKAMTHTSNLSRYSSSSGHPYNSRPLSMSINGNNNRKSLNRPSTLSLGPPVDDNTPESDFFTKQARLQIEARMALAQAKDMAHMQMEIERQKQKQSPITEVIRNSLEKVGVPFPPEKRRVSRQMLTDMNIAQLQIIVNELHSQIERLNEQLVQYLMERDELHMSQDSMLVDIEDLTRYLGAKEQSKANEKATNNTTNSASTNSTTKGTHTLQQSAVTNSPANTGTSNHSQSKFQRIASLVKK